jgi:hypothetical protein
MEPEHKKLAEENAKLREALLMVYGFYMAPSGTVRTTHPAYPRIDDNYKTKRLVEHVKSVLGLLPP